MAYLGNSPARSFISFERQVFTIVNSQTAYTLDHSVTNENDIRLVVNNIVQEPGSGKAYTASGTTLTLSAALVNGTDEMYCVFLGRAVGTVNAPAGSVGTSQLVDDAVTLAKMASGTDGNIISYDASGDPVAVATGSAGQVLTSAGAGSPPTFADASGGAYEKLETITISGTTSQIEPTNSLFTSTYRDYRIIFSNMLISSDAEIHLRIGETGSATVSSSHYHYANMGYNSSGSETKEYSTSATAFKIFATTAGTSTDQTHNFIIDIFNPLDTSTYPTWSLRGQFNTNNNNISDVVSTGAMEASKTTVYKRYTFYCSAGDWTSGTATLYGRKN